MRKSGGKFPITCKIFEKYIKQNPKHEDLLFKKSIYPYEYMDSFEKFKEKSLPKFEKFYSTLNMKQITQEEYKLANDVWSQFNIKNMGQYHDFYCLLDTSLLCDVFQVFRKTVFKTYGLDAGHFYSIPGLAWSAALKFTGIELELMKDIDMYMFIENGIRGGICGVMKRYATANNKYIKNYDSSKEDSYLCHLDVNNLYGKSLSEKLPVSGFEWISKELLNKIDWINIDTNSNVGYIIECDLKYPESYMIFIQIFRLLR